MLLISKMDRAKYLIFSDQYPQSHIAKNVNHLEYFNYQSIYEVLKLNESDAQKEFINELTLLFKEKLLTEFRSVNSPFPGVQYAIPSLDNYFEQKWDCSLIQYYRTMYEAILIQDQIKPILNSIYHYSESTT